MTAKHNKQGVFITSKVPLTPNAQESSEQKHTDAQQPMSQRPGECHISLESVVALTGGNHG
jgi:hypothetical protein